MPEYGVAAGEEKNEGKGDENHGERDLYGAEMAFTWRPPGQSRYRGLTWRAGVMALDGLVSGVMPLPGLQAMAWASKLTMSNVAHVPAPGDRAVLSAGY